MKEFRILINGETYLGEWSDCSKVDIEYMENLMNSLNNNYGNTWQVIYK